MTVQTSRGKRSPVARHAIAVRLHVSGVIPDRVGRDTAIPDLHEHRGRYFAVDRFGRVEPLTLSEAVALRAEMGRAMDRNSGLALHEDPAALARLLERAASLLALTEN